MSGRCVALALALALLCAGQAAAVGVHFMHGVASGDPLPTAMVIWTRVEPRILNTTLRAAAQVPVRWAVGTDQVGLWSLPEKTGTFTTNADRDFTVKIDVQGLRPGVQYYYQFEVTDEIDVYKPTVTSPIGKFKTPRSAGQNVKKLRYAIFSCSNWGWGYFNAYDAATRFDLDFWLHLGDYIYEYSPDTYPTPTQAVRYAPPPNGLKPNKEIVTLDDYRERFKTYHQDPGLQALRAHAALLSIWDDHEITNNARRDSAQNHQPDTEGDYYVRKAVATKAYHEQMPTREIDVNGAYVGPHLNKTSVFGNLATLIMLESRATARTLEPTVQASYLTGNLTALMGSRLPSQVNTASDVTTLAQIRQAAEAIREDPTAQQLGPEQMAWVARKTQEALSKGTKWMIYGHGTPMLERYFYDYEGAIARKRAVDPVTAARWEAVYKNATEYQPVATVPSTGTMCYNVPYLGKPVTITNSTRLSVRAGQLAGKYKITRGFDTWVGFSVERRKFLDIATTSPNTVQYGGDSHADWAGQHRHTNGKYVAEFDVAGVTSPTRERDAFFPMDMLTDAVVQPSYDTGLRWSQGGRKGFMLITLTKTKHHTEYWHVDTICHTNYKLSCTKAFDYLDQAGRTASGNSDIVEGTCGRIPKGRPYERIAELNNALGRQSSFLA